jgi:hypothetical protein
VPKYAAISQRLATTTKSAARETSGVSLAADKIIGEFCCPQRGGTKYCLAQATESERKRLKCTARLASRVPQAIELDTKL